MQSNQMAHYNVQRRCVRLHRPWCRDTNRRRTASTLVQRRGASVLPWWRATLCWTAPTPATYVVLVRTDDSGSESIDSEAKAQGRDAGHVRGAGRDRRFGVGQHRLGCKGKRLRNRAVAVPLSACNVERSAGGHGRGGATWCWTAPTAWQASTWCWCGLTIRRRRASTRVQRQHVETLGSDGASDCIDRGAGTRTDVGLHRLSCKGGGSAWPW